MTKSDTIIHVNLARGFRGGERQTELLIRALAEKGFKQSLICRRGEPLADRCKDIPNVRIVPVSNIFQGHFARHGEIAHAHEAKGVYWSWLHSLIWRTPYILTRRVPYQIGKNFFTRKAYKKAGACIGVSTAVSNILSATLKRKVHTILDCHSDFCPSLENVRKIKSGFGEGPIIGHIGALVDSNKGQSTLIEAFKEIKESFPNAHLLFLGEGPDRTMFQRLANHDPHIHFLGFKKNVEDYLKAMDLFAFPSNEEALGSILLDAMFLEVPIVATAVGGIPELLSTDRGLLVPSKKPQALARSVIEILTNKEVKNHIVNAALKFSKRCSPSDMAQQYLKIWTLL